MRRFYVPPECIQKNKIYIRAKEAHYLKDVLRIKENSRIIVFDGKGRQYNCVVTRIEPNEVSVDIESNSFTLSKDTAYKLTLAQAIPNKPGKMNFIIEKAVELGVYAVIPIKAERSVVKLDNISAINKQEKWQKIATEASKQCGRVNLPEIGRPVFVKEAVSALAGAELKLFPCVNKDAAALQSVLKDISMPKTVAVFIGPEGDFTASEIDIAKQAGFKIVSLGGRVLRTETAGLYVLSVLDYLFG